MNKVLRIELDSDAECPMDWDGSWTLYSFSRRSIHHKNPDEFFPLSIGMRSKLRAGLAFFLDYYEHGQGAYSIHGEGMQCQWDTAPGAGLLVWEHKPKEMGAKTAEDRAKDARNFLETYNAWANGNVYGFILEEMDGTHIDSCWGFYDPESMMDHASGGLEDGDKLKVVGLDYFINQKHMPPGVELVDEFDEESEAEEQEAWNCRA